MYLWIKALHIIFMVTWFAGIFYLPRLFVYHAMSSDPVSLERFKVMERKLFWGIMTPGAVLTVLCGAWLLYGYAWRLYGQAMWLHTKIALVAVLIVYHVYCGKLMRDFACGHNRRSHVWYRVYNEVPVMLLVAIILLVVVKPF